MEMNFASTRKPIKLTATPITEDEIRLFAKLLGDKTCDFYIMWPMTLEDTVKISGDISFRDITELLLVDPDTGEKLFQNGVAMDHTVFYRPIVDAITKHVEKEPGKL